MISRRVLRREGFRFELRPYDTAYAAQVFAAILESKAEIRPWMDWLHPDYSQADAENWATHATSAWEAGSEYEFLIFDRQDGTLAGSGGLNRINTKDHVCNLGYWVRTSKTRLGAATQATCLLADFGLSELKFNRIEIVAADGNAASRRVAEKAGAIYEGLQRRRVKVGDKVYDGHMYAII
jgi:RimJ/RimL family protein N-acetyltransferase